MNDDLLHDLENPTALRFVAKNMFLLFHGRFEAGPETLRSVLDVCMPAERELLLAWFRGVGVLPSPFVEGSERARLTWYFAARVLATTARRVDMSDLVREYCEIVSGWLLRKAMAPVPLAYDVRLQPLREIRCGLSVPSTA